MELSIATLKASGGFVGAPVKKEITWHSDGKPHKATVYVRKDSFQKITERWGQKQEGADWTANRIATSICDKDGNSVFTAADIQGGEAVGHGGITAELTIVLLNAISDANGTGGQDATAKK